MLDDTAAAPEAPVADTPAPAPEAPAKVERVEELNAKEAAEKALDDDLRKAFRNSKRERSDDGKFAPKDGNISPPKAKEAPPAPQAEAKDAKPVESKTDQQPEAGKVEPAKPQPPAIDAPASWSAEMKAKWAALPSEAQQYVAQREQEAHSKISQLGQYAKQMEPVREVLDAHQAYLRNVPMPPTQLLNKLLDASRRLDTGDAVGVIRELIQNYRVDPFTLIDDGATQQQSSPEVARLERELAQMRAEQQQWRSEREQQVKSAEEAKLNALYSEVDQFAKDKADWSTLQADIIANVAAIREAKPQASNAEVLQDAYDRARWANPVTRAKMQQELQAQADAKRIEEAKKAAASATTANKLNVGGSRPTQSAPADIDSDLRAIWRKNRA